MDRVMKITSNEVTKSISSSAQLLSVENVPSTNAIAHQNDPIRCKRLHPLPSNEEITRIVSDERCTMASGPVPNICEINKKTNLTFCDVKSGGASDNSLTNEIGCRTNTTSSCSSLSSHSDCCKHDGCTCYNNSINLIAGETTQFRALCTSFYRFLARYSGRRRSEYHQPSYLSHSRISFVSLWLILLAPTLFSVADGCSSRATPKPRPPTATPRPNVTFHTYACPPEYAAWYCLNGATCFTIKIGDALLYNCECAEGYQGPRCEFKDLDGSYLPSQRRYMLEKASIAGGAIIALFLVFIICLTAYIRVKRREKKRDTIAIATALAAATIARSPCGSKGDGPRGITNKSMVNEDCVDSGSPISAGAGNMSPQSKFILPNSIPVPQRVFGTQRWNGYLQRGINETFVMQPIKTNISYSRENSQPDYNWNQEEVRSIMSDEQHRFQPSVPP